MASLARRQREREPAQMSTPDPFRTFRDLLRWSPFSDMDLFPRTGESVFTPDIEIKETPEALVMKADLPGMREDDIDIAITGNRLTISGRREEEKRQENEQYYAYERQYGSFSRSFVLTDTYDADNVNAEMKDGVLTVTVPKRPGAQARRIPVRSQSQPQGQTVEARQMGGRGAESQTAARPETQSTGRSGSEPQTAGRGAQAGGASRSS